MKKNKIIKKFAKLSVYTLLVALGTGCTDKFEEYNTNPFGPKPDQMLGDNAITGSLIKSMIPALVQGQQNNSQMLDQMIGSEYGGEITCIAQWGNGGNYYTYNPRVGWYGNMFDTTMPQIYTGYFQIRDLSDGKGLAYQWAQILRVAASLKISDCYGPIPYSQITGTAFTVEYDNMEDLYKHMFDDLDEAISAFKVAVLGNEDMSSLSEYDLVFNGDFNKWVKFANSLRLRLAMRLAFVKPEVAKEQAEKAISHSLGVITSNDDNAGVKTVGANDVVNQLYTMWANYKDIRMGASIWSILTGYEDPRLSKMFTQGTLNETSGYFALRTGLNLDSNKDSRLGYSSPNIQSNTPIIWINAAEVAFLKAEGALRGWNMGGATPQSAYEEGIRLSFNEWGASGANEYMTDEVKTAANYVDPLKSSNNIGAVSNITIGWKENDSKDKKLERIITQKWIATFPNGQEAWTEFRRTGYPKLFPVAVNNSSGTVDTDIQIRRLPFAKSEYTLNPQNIQEAIQLLGGQDNGGTRLWWDIENKSIN